MIIIHKSTHPLTIADQVAADFIIALQPNGQLHCTKQEQPYRGIVTQNNVSIKIATMQHEMLNSASPKI